MNGKQMNGKQAYQQIVSSYDSGGILKKEKSWEKLSKKEQDYYSGLAQKYSQDTPLYTEL